MLRIDSTVLRIILLAVSAAGIVLFLMPFAVRIVNIGNLFGLAVSVLLFCFVVFNKPVSAFLDSVRAHTAGRIVLSVIFCTVLFGMLYCLIVSGMMLHAAHKKPKQPPQAVIVLGCKVRGTVPSLMLSRRIQAAYQVLAADPSLTAVVSGGKGSDEDISEAACMKRELTARGIDESRIIMEDQSTTTSENLRFSQKLLREHGIDGGLLIATDGYHELRAQYLAGLEGLPECGAVSAYTSWYLLPTYVVREWFGYAHAVVFGN